MNSARSAELYESALAVIPGGVNSPVRAFGSVGGTPRFIERGEGPWIFDADGNRYIDFVLSWGALPLGHAHPDVVEAVTAQARRGTTFGAPTALETALTERIAAAVPSIEMVRFVSSGTEAVMSAVRLARAATGRRRIVKFAGCYHGHSDSLLVAGGSGLATFGLPGTPGVTPGAVAETLTAEFNDLSGAAELMERHGNEIAAVIVEPVAGNMGLVLPVPGFLEGLRELCSKTGALLIFDEVMTGFRVAYGGAQAHFGVMPDLTCLGKVMGGGLPAAAYGGPRSLMRRIAPAGDVYQAGTLSGNPLAMAAGIATLDHLRQGGIYELLGAASGRMAEGVRVSGGESRVPVQAAAIGGMWGFFLADEAVRDFRSARAARADLFAEFFHAMLERGVYLPPSQFEACFM
ncbi:MAG TPA: glutamate-1-semialdehyde 2,1-aminomutase [Gemmatimonadales bacterium]|nr:glutamate-1-semialdehyde 2,1-aminomutase [Gemmatimonadales bacterium]